jgi:hypothetical protein
MHTHKKLKEALYSIIALAFIIWAIVYVQTRSSPVEDTFNPPAVITEDRVQKLGEMSKTVDVPKATVELKTKLQAMAKTMK